MDLATLDITREEAIERLAHYREAIARERNAEDEAIAAGLRAAARGLPVISLSQTIAAGGWFPNGLPRIAVVRADATECWVEVRSWSQNRWSVTFCSEAWDRGRAAVGRNRVRVTVPGPGHYTNREWHASTIVPLIPPQHRPKRGRLGRFHVLWEVEQWTPEPPRDPALLRHIRGDLWAVQAVWDLTELERAVLSARLRTT
jgi:hypothetical protein